MTDLSRDIMELARCAAQYKTDALAPMGLKGFHSSYLSAICLYPGISQDKLAQLICINKSNIARQAAFLEEEGFIIRKPSQSDKRVMELYPTEKTHSLFPKIQEVLRQWELLLTKDLTEDEIIQIATLLQRMKQRASSWMEGK